MAIENQEDKSKISLSVGIQDLVEIVSKSSHGLSLSQYGGDHSSRDAEELKKEWFRHLLISLEKLHNSIDNIHRTDMPDLKKEMKKELDKVESNLKEDIDKAETLFKNEIIRIEKALLKNEISTADVSKTTASINEKVTELRTKMALIGVLAGSIGSLIFLILKAWLLTP